MVVNYLHSDTIAAVASPSGSGGRGIIRISGKVALKALDAIMEWKVIPTCYPHIPYGTILSGDFRIHSNISLPCHVYVWPDKRSYTGELVAEVHTCQAPPLLDVLLESLCTHDVRIARPGEFTLRAFLHGRLDLTRAEAVLGVIDAQSQRELLVALDQLCGGFSDSIKKLRNALIDLQADLEAGLDFVDDDIRFISAPEIQDRLRASIATLDTIFHGLRGRLVSGGSFRVTLWGRPNSGKSTLLNALLGESHSITSSHAGTTRDVVVARTVWNEIPLEIYDTAGIPSRSDGSHIQQHADRQTELSRDQAHLDLLCVDLSRPLDSDERRWITERVAAGQLTVATKSDLPMAWEAHPPIVQVSATTATGLAALQETILASLHSTQSGEVVTSTAARCQTLAADALHGLNQALELVQQDAGDELVASEIWRAINSLGEMVGVVYHDDLLDRIFSRFCIGK